MKVETTRRIFRLLLNRIAKRRFDIATDKSSMYRRRKATTSTSQEEVEDGIAFQAGR